MRVAYIDLKVNNPPETYSVHPTRYGGGGVVARYAKELLNKRDTFHIFASPDCFDDLTDQDNRAACFPIEDWKLASMRSGAPIKQFIPNADSYDVFLFHHDCMTLNMAGLKAPLVHWALMGDGRANHPNTPYSLLYLRHERAVYGKTLYVTLGKPQPPFVPVKKEDYLFQCTRHDPHMNSIEAAKFCLEHKVKGYFAGPIHQGYPLMDYIDNEHTFYMGMISEQDKLSCLQKARLCPLLFQWDCPFNQSAIEALSCGTPLVVNPRGFLKELVRNGENGLYHTGNLKDAWDRALSLSPAMCHASVSKYSETNMVASFRAALDVVLADWRSIHGN